ncbi:hypothetical protein [Proteus sp. ZN5]|uniref:hypothetical protein n=1 Tax=Proteus sp. ZN5 TaxID=2697019 RepID=UPI0013E1E1F6|nr:hypothetical protein [Proteus sp. ZN5]QIG04562.1 hypothetical protein GTK47_04040 [Proteus sp. ZN5]
MVTRITSETPLSTHSTLNNEKAPSCVKINVISAQNTSNSMTKGPIYLTGNSIFYSISHNGQEQSGINKTGRSTFYAKLNNSQEQIDTRLNDFIQNTKNNESLIKETIESIRYNFEELIDLDKKINNEYEKEYKAKINNILSYINKNDVNNLIHEKKFTEANNYSNNLKKIKEVLIDIIIQYSHPDDKNTPTILSKIEKQIELINNASIYTR